MHEHELWITALLNRYLAGLANTLLAWVGLEAEDPAHPWPNYVALQLLVALILVVLALLARANLSVERPGKLQHVVELIYGFLRNQMEEIAGARGLKYVHLCVTIFLFILCCNLLGTFPTLEPPTMFPAVPLGCALLVFLYYHAVGIRAQGPVGYLKHFAGPVWWLAPIMVPIELISHLSRPLSLTVRLFANMFAGENVFMVFLALTYLGAPVAFMGLHLFAALVQAYIFTLLTMVYIEGAIAHEH